MKRYSLKAAMDAGFECSSGPSAGHVCSEKPPERAADPEPPGYTATFDRIFISLGNELCKGLAACCDKIDPNCMLNTQILGVGIVY